MSTERDLPRILQTWLHEDAYEYGDRVLDSVLDLLDSTPQSSASRLARRFQIMNNNLVRYGLAAAAVVVIAVIAFNLLPGSPAPGGEPSATPEPTATPEASVPEPSASEAAGLPVGSSHVLWDTPGEVGISVTIPAPGWNGDVGRAILTNASGADPFDGAGMIVFQGDLYVYGDPCQWSGTAPNAPATTVDELVAALAAQASRDASAPVDITVDGYTGKSITLHVPEDAAFSAGEFTDCDEGYFGSWTIRADLEPYRYHQGPGQIDELWILDVDGVLTVIDTNHYPGTPADLVEELRAIAESATFELP